MEEEKSKKNENTTSLQEAITGTSGLLAEKKKEVPTSFAKYSSTLKPLRTYQGDVDEAVSHTKASVVSIAVAEQKRKVEVEPKNFQLESKLDENKNRLFVYFGLIFFVLGIIILSTVYFFRTKNVEQKTQKTDSVISYNEIFDLPIVDTTRDAFIKNIIERKKGFNKPLNSILYINAGSDIKNFLALLAPNIPPSLQRTLSKDYMIGIYSFDTNEPFIIFKTEDYGTSYSGMLKWENNIIGDLGKIFGIEARVGTSSPYVFVDEALKNKDLRIVKNDTGKTILLYSFIDKNTILITSNENIFNALLGKYFNSQMIR